MVRLKPDQPDRLLRPWLVALGCVANCSSRDLESSSQTYLSPEDILKRGNQAKEDNWDVKHVKKLGILKN